MELTVDCLYRVWLPNGHLTDMVNLTRAKDAARCLALGILNTQVASSRRPSPCPAVPDRRRPARARAQPLPRADALTEPAIGDSGSKEWLQPDEQRCKPGRKAMADRHEHAAEIKAVHHEPGCHAVPDARGAGPLRPRQQFLVVHVRSRVVSMAAVGEATLGHLKIH
jgi:hypothetical protein